MYNKQKLTRRSRKFGWGYSFTPSGTGPRTIERPTKPNYVGTIKQVFEAKASDKTYNAHKDTALSSQQYFLNGFPVKGDPNLIYDLYMLLEGQVDEIEVKV